MASSPAREVSSISSDLVVEGEHLLPPLLHLGAPGTCGLHDDGDLLVVRSIGGEGWAKASKEVLVVSVLRLLSLRGSLVLLGVAVGIEGGDIVRRDHRDVEGEVLGGVVGGRINEDVRRPRGVISCDDAREADWLNSDVPPKLLVAGSELVPHDVMPGGLLGVVAPCGEVVAIEDIFEGLVVVAI